ncbi:MAG TPA: hypothetical protein VIX82_17145 [Solirubrobacteraceae bacterium]
MYNMRTRLIVRFVAVLILAGGGVAAKIVLSHSGSGSTSSNPTNVSADQSLYRPANLQKAISAVKGKVGSHAQLLELSLLPGQADFTLRNGEKAFGYRWSATDQSLAPLSINVIGSGSLQGQDFPFSQAQPDAMGKIVSALAKQGMTPATMTLRRQVSDGVLGWAVSADGGGRTSVAYTANVGGSHVVNVEQAAAAAANVASQAASQASSQASQAAAQASQAAAQASQGSQSGSSALKAAQKMQQCVANANGDTNALSLCVSQH